MLRFFFFYSIFTYVGGKLRYFYCAKAEYVNIISQQGISSNEKAIPIIVVDERFLMYQFVIDSFAFEILETDEFCFFEISAEAITGNIVDLQTDNLFAPFFKLLKQSNIGKNFLTPQVTDRYDSMGFDIGVFLVENKQNFNDTYKRKILEYAKESQ